MDNEKTARDLQDRLVEIGEMLDAFHKDLTDYLYDNLPAEIQIVSGEFSRVIEQFKALQDIPLTKKTNLWPLLGLEAHYHNDPSRGNMLLLQISRLERSSEKADIALREFLILKNKDFVDESFASEDPRLPEKDVWHPHSPARQVIALAEKKRWSISRAAKKISEITGKNAKTLENQVAKMKRNKDGSLIDEE